MRTVRRLVLTTVAALAAGAAMAAPAHAEGPSIPVAGELVQTVVFKGPATTTPMSFTGFGNDKSLVQPDGTFAYSAPGDEGTDLCTAKEGVTGLALKKCSITMSGELTSTKLPITGTPVHGPVCDRTTGRNGQGELRIEGGPTYRLSNIGWITSLQGSVITGNWAGPNGESGTLKAPVNTRRGLGCLKSEGTTDFSISGTALFFRNGG